MPVNNELIESYLTNRLSSTEAAEFEALMAKDPLLKQEVTLQKDVIDSIQRIRKAELKARLNNIDVASSTLNLTSKIAASILISSLIGTGLFLYINSQEQNTIATNGASQKPQVVFNNTEKAEKPVQNSNTETVVVTPAQNAPVANNTPVQQRNRHNNTTSNNVVAVAPDNNVPEEMAIPVKPDFDDYPSEETERGDNSSSQGANIGGNVQESNKVELEPEFKAGKSGEYAYQYYSNKLFLYGFDATKTYDIREFNNKNGKKQIFMKINGMYFHLNNNQKEKTPMSPIQDKALLEQLNSVFK